MRDAVAGALAALGARAIVLTGWGSLGALGGRGGSTIELSDVPHDWLLPRVAAVVHHGGAGTTAAALRAGVPSVIVPHAYDQRFWGRRLHALGCAPAPIEEGDLSSAALADALRRALDDCALRDRAAELGTRIRAEDGPARAVTLLEQWMEV